MSVFRIVKKELVCHIANWLVLFLKLKPIIIFSVKFFLYDLLYTGFSSFKTEYIYEKQYKIVTEITMGEPRSFISTLLGMGV